MKTKKENPMNTKTTGEVKTLKGSFTRLIMLLVIATTMITTDCFAQQKKSTKSKTTDKTTETTTAAPVTPSKESVMRKLWSDHIVWTRQYMISEMSSSADKEAIFNRLRQNSIDIAKAMKEQYPAIDDKALTGLLDSTVMTMTTLIFQTNTGSEGIGAYETKEALMKHLDRLAIFLNAAHPGWSLPELKIMLQGYLNETHNEILARKNKIWEADIAAYDRLNNHVMKLADAFATGTITLDGGQPPVNTDQNPQKTAGQKNGTNSAGTGK